MNSAAATNHTYSNMNRRLTLHTTILHRLNKKSIHLLNGRWILAMTTLLQILPI